LGSLATFIAHLSLRVSVKEFLIPVNILRSYDKMFAADFSGPPCTRIEQCAGASIPPTTKALSLTSPFSLPSPFPSFPSLPSPPSPSLHSPPAAKRPPLKPDRDLRERCNLPQWGLGRKPQRTSILVYSERKTHLTAIFIWIFVC